MNPQILIDGVQHGARGCILLLDNRRMAAISGPADGPVRRGLRHARLVWRWTTWPGRGRSLACRRSMAGAHRRHWSTALERARAHAGLSLVHVPVYFGPDELGGMGVFGRWNVGNWCAETQALRHEIGL